MPAPSKMLSLLLAPAALVHALALLSAHGDFQVFAIAFVRLLMLISDYRSF